MDFSGLTDEDLSSILASQGLQDLEHLSRREKEILVRSIVGGENESEDNSSHQDEPMVVTGQQIPLQPLSEAVLPGLSASEILDHDNTSPKVPVVSQPNLNSSDGNQPMETSSTQPEPEEELDEEKSLAISQFCEMTGSDPAYAKNVLVATSWNLETAVSLHLEGVGLSRTNSYTPAVAPRPPPVSMEESDDYHPGIPGIPFPLPLNGAADWQRLMNMRRHYIHREDSEDQDEQLGPQPIEYDEDGIRRPDQVKVQRLISRQSSEGDWARAEDPNVDWLFPPPRHLSSQETLESAKAQGKEEKRWLLVNIQSHDEFPSHLLNRDTWTNDSIESILRTSFLFWQRGHTTPDGQKFMRLYRIPEDQLPHICIIDPRTGANLFDWTGFIEPDELAVKLTDFADKHQFASAGPVASADNSNRNSLQASDVANDLPSKDQVINEVNRAESTAESIKAEIPPAKPTIDYGPVPVIPNEKDPDQVKIAIKLSNGKSIQRKYYKNELVRALFATVIEADPESHKRQFDLISRFPPLTLSTCLDKSLEECQLAGGNLLHRWV